MDFQVVVNADAVLQTLAAWTARSADLRPLLAATKRAYEEYIAHVFDLEGPGWAPLRPLTVAKKGHSRILDETGGLRGSYSGGSGHVENMTFDSVEWGSDLRQAAPLEEGFFNRGYYPGSPEYPARQMRGTPVVARPVFRLMTVSEENQFADEFERALVQSLGI